MATHLGYFDALHVAARINFGLYMESGYYDLLGTGRCGETSYRPALLDFGAYGATGLQGYGHISSDAPYFLSDGVIEGESKSLGCITKVPKLHICGATHVSDTLSVDELGNTELVGQWCTNGLRDRKFVQAVVKPSLYTGKLMRYVQSVYGSLRTDYVTDENSPGSAYPLTIAGANLLYTFPTSGIYCTSDYRYFLLTVSGTTVTYQVLKPSAVGEQWRASLLAHAGSLSASAKIQAEAYLLSTCSAYGNEATEELTGATIIGQPYAYGWHFAQDGHSASMVTGTTNYPTDNWWHSYQYTVNFSLSEIVDPETGVIYSTITGDVVAVVSDAAWSPTDLGDLLVPQWSTGLMDNYVSLGGHTAGTVVMNMTAPVYCYYNNDDELQLIEGYVTVQANQTGTSEVFTLPCGGFPANEMLVMSSYIGSTTGLVNRSYILNGSTIVGGNTSFKHNIENYGYWSPTGPEPTPSTGEDYPAAPGIMQYSLNYSIIPAPCGSSYANAAEHGIANNWHALIGTTYGGMEAGFQRNIGDAASVVAEQYQVYDVVTMIPYGDASACIFGVRERSKVSGSLVSRYIGDKVAFTSIYAYRGSPGGSVVQVYFSGPSKMKFLTGSDYGLLNQTVEDTDELLSVRFYASNAITDGAVDVSGPITGELYGAVFDIPIGVDPTGYFHAFATRGANQGYWFAPVGGLEVKVNFTGNVAAGWA